MHAKQTKSVEQVITLLFYMHAKEAKRGKKDDVTKLFEN
jgi:hypothetical protein